MQEPKPKRQLAGSDGEFLIPREVESVEESQYDEVETTAELKPDAIPHQVFYPVIAALWVGVALVLLPRLPVLQADYPTLERAVSATLFVLACLATTLLVYLPAAVFDRLIPGSARLSMTQTYTRALKISINFVSGGRVRFQR